MGIVVDFGGFGGGEEEVDGADPFVAGGDEGSGGAVWGSELCFLDFEGAQLFSDLDPFVEELGEGMGRVVGVGANFGRSIWASAADSSHSATACTS